MPGRDSGQLNGDPSRQKSQAHISSTLVELSMVSAKSGQRALFIYLSLQLTATGQALPQFWQWAMLAFSAG